MNWVGLEAKLGTQVGVKLNIQRPTEKRRRTCFDHTYLSFVQEPGVRKKLSSEEYFSTFQKRCVLPFRWLVRSHGGGQTSCARPLPGPRKSVRTS